MAEDNRHFPCERCGICCRNIGNATFARDMVLPGGVCKYLDEETNLCRIYSARPIFCNADAFYEKYLSKKMTRQEFYRQNKRACRKFQGRETSFDATELEEWVLPAIQNLKNESNAQGAANLTDLDKELTLDKLSKKERKIYEDNNLVPFEQNILSSASNLPPAILKQMKAQEWKQFEELAGNPAEQKEAEQHLENYIGLVPPDEKEAVCYEFFLDFSQGRKGISNLLFAEKMLKEISDTRDADKLLDIVFYFEQRHDLAKAEPFYFTLYEIFFHGEGIERDLVKATNYLKASILGNNTEEKREALREVYEQRNRNLDKESRIKKAYESVIADNIQFSKNDYAVYLREQGEYAGAVHWFAADGKFAEAYELVNIKVKEKIDAAIEEFEAANAGDDEYLKALKLMQTKFKTLEDIFAFDKPEKTPRTYIAMALLYTIFGVFYTFVRTAQRSPFATVAGILITGAAIFGGWKIGHAGLGVLPLAVWTFILMYLDFKRRKKFVSACELWLDLPEHPELKERELVFKDSQKIVNGTSVKSGIFILPVFVIIISALATFGLSEMSPESRAELFSQISHEIRDE